MTLSNLVAIAYISCDPVGRSQFFFPIYVQKTYKIIALHDNNNNHHRFLETSKEADIEMILFCLPKKGGNSTFFSVPKIISLTHSLDITHFLSLDYRCKPVLGYKCKWSVVG